MNMTVRTLHADIACADHSSTQQSCGSAPEGNVRAVAMDEAHIETKQSIFAYPYNFQPLVSISSPR